MTKVMNSRRLRTVILRVKDGLCRGTASGAKLPFVVWDEKTSQGSAVTYESNTSATRRI